MSALPAAVRLLVDADALVIGERDPGAAAAVGRLGPEAAVVLVDERPGARGRLRRSARRLGLRIEQEYVVLPSARRAAFVVEDHPSTLAWVWQNLATVPPGVSRAAAVVDAAVSLVAGLGVVNRLGTVAPGRVVVARRP